MRQNLEWYLNNVIYIYIYIGIDECLSDVCSLYAFLNSWTNFNEICCVLFVWFPG